MRNDNTALDNENKTTNRVLSQAKNYLSHSKINKKNKAIITSFVNYLAADDLTKNRQSKYIYTCIQLPKDSTTVCSLP